MNVSKLSSKEIEKRINANDWLKVISYSGYTIDNSLQLSVYKGDIYSYHQCECLLEDIEFIIYEGEKNENS